jgi:hypothetical protein
MTEVAKHVRTEPDGTRIFEFEGNEITEERLTELMERQYEREALLKEWKESLELPDHDQWRSEQALENLRKRAIDEPRQEQFLRELERVKPKPEEAS